MTSNSKSQVLFLFDPGCKEAEALRAVAALMGKQPVEITGLFVEDADLLGAAKLPVFAEVSIKTLAVTTTDSDALQVAMASQAHRARRLFEATARGLALEHRFEITQGRTIDTLRQRIEHQDAVIVSRPLPTFGIPARSGNEYTS